MPPYVFGAEELALIAAIHATPREDTPRLAYADWLQENGQETYAEWIRLDCDLDRWVAGDHSGDEAELDARTKELYPTVSRQWIEWCAPHPWPTGAEYREREDGGVSFVHTTPSRAAGFFRRGIPVFDLPSEPTVDQLTNIISAVNPRLRFRVCLDSRMVCFADSLLRTRRIQEIVLKGDYRPAALRPAGAGPFTPIPAEAIRAVAALPFLTDVEVLFIPFRRYSLTGETEQLCRDLLVPHFPDLLD